jgi:uncharacterized membrane protein
LPIANYLTVAAISAISGGFAVPAGFLLGLHPIETYLSAAVGSSVFLWIFVPLAAKAFDRVMRGREISPKAEASIAGINERWGVKGIGLFGPIFPGVTISSLLGLALGHDPKELARWLSIGAALLYAVYTLGIWLIFILFE